MTTSDLKISLLLFAAGGLGGAVAQAAHLPMPWMLGSLLTTALAVGVFKGKALDDYRYPTPLRTGMVTMIGVMIGTQVSPALLAQLTALPLTFAALAVFVVVAHVGNYTIFHRLGGFDRATAFYSGTPGGLMESILMGEEAGADARIITIQQFMRIVLVITLVPVGLSLWEGRPLGSASGMLVPGGDVGPADLTEVLLIGCAAAGGLWLGKLVRLPASQIIGPLLLTGALTVTGLIELHLPFWLIALAQVVIGTGLGIRFRGISLAMLKRSAGLAILTVGFMLILGAMIAEALVLTTGIPFIPLLISFAPGGVTEMSLVALSLAANPALVSLHHVMRIILTVLLMGTAARWMGINRGKPGA